MHVWWKAILAAASVECNNKRSTSVIIAALRLGHSNLISCLRFLQCSGVGRLTQI